MRAFTKWLVLVAAVAAGCGSCGGDETNNDANNGEADGGVGADGSPTGDGGNNVSRDDAGCVVLCGSEGVCCSAAQECVLGECVEACPGARCGDDDSICCQGDQLCLDGACQGLGNSCGSDSACPEGSVCEPLVGRCVTVPEDASCRYIPMPGVFEPEVQWEWLELDAVSIPLVVPLDDDNGDGVVDVRDVPDVVVTISEDIYANPSGGLIALSGDTGVEHWRTAADVPVCFAVQPAAADIDADGSVEIVVGTCGTTPGIAAISATGEVEWMSDAPALGYFSSISIANIDGAGNPEILTSAGVFSADGTLRWTAPELAGSGISGSDVPIAVDLDADEELEVLTPFAALNHDGSTLWTNPNGIGGHVAVARVLESAASSGPQVVHVTENTFTVLDGETGAVLLGPAVYDPSSATSPQVGTPTIADFDGDGVAEVGVAGRIAYWVFDATLPAPHVLWSFPTEDVTHGSVGSTVFDFDFDGKAEVVWADECHLRIIDGVTGQPLWFDQRNHPTAYEYPLVADVDNDGNAELLVTLTSMATAPIDFKCGDRAFPFTTMERGVRVYRDKLDNWVPTRTIWNQQSYHIDNVEADGSVPQVEASGWNSHNTFRLNQLLDPDAVSLSPDLRVVAAQADVSSCPSSATLRARVENRGTRGVSAGVPVAFYGGAPGASAPLLAVENTSSPLLAGQAIWVETVVENPMLDAEGTFRFYAVVDDAGDGTGQHNECIEDNNVGEAVAAVCPIDQ